MKFALTLLLIASSQMSWAMPFRCVSTELVDGKPLINAKINPPRLIQGFNRHVVGVTPGKGLRWVTYGSGSANNEEISLTFVDDNFITGTLLAYDKGEAGVLEGTFQHSKARRAALQVRCTKL